MGAHETKTFKSGNGVALRLPKSLGIGPDERMLIERNGDVLTVRRLKGPAEESRPKGPAKTKRKPRKQGEDHGAKVDPSEVHTLAWSD